MSSSIIKPLFDLEQMAARNGSNSSYENGLTGQDILSVAQFDTAKLEYIFGRAHEMREMVARVGTFDLLKGKILANLFYEPSTRTSSSFTAAKAAPATWVDSSQAARRTSFPAMDS